MLLAAVLSIPVSVNVGEKITVRGTNDRML